MGKTNKQTTQEDNTVKITGGASGKGFDVLGQPSPEKKREGWERRQMRQKLMDFVFDNLNTPLEDFQKKLETINSDKKVTLLEAIGAKYSGKVYNSERFLLDFFDRHIEKAPQKMEHMGDEGKDLSLQATVVILPPKQ